MTPPPARSFLALLPALLALASCSDADAPAPAPVACNALPGDPAQPCSGPGAADYPLGQTVKILEITVADIKYWLRTPSIPKFSPPAVLVYLHGAALEPPTAELYGYATMLQHFAMKGYTVVYPVSTTTGLGGGLPSATTIVKAAQDLAPRMPAGARFIYAGHSLGAMQALLAAIVPNSDPSAPLPEAVVLHDPAGLSYLPTLPDTAGQIRTRFLIIQAETSRHDPNSYSEIIWTNTSGVTHPRNYLLVRSDDRGSAPLVSDHDGACHRDETVGALEAASLDAIDWYGYWRPTEGAIAEALGAPFPGYSAFCAGAGRECDPVRHMGVFKNGVAVQAIQNAAELAP